VLLGSSAFNYGMGTHLVARVDGMPLTGDMVNAMADFCRFHLGPHFEKCAAAASSSEDQKNSSSTPPSPAELELDDQLKPESWRTYLEQWNAEQIDRTQAERVGVRAYTIVKARAGKERMGLTEDDCERLTSILFNTHAQYIETYQQKYGGS
jgi:hypothetical protein